MHAYDSFKRANAHTHIEQLGAKCMIYMGFSVHFPYCNWVQGGPKR